MSLIVKICGLRTAETLDAALDAGADMVGFVFFAPSPRNIDFATARELGRRVKNRVKVALTVDAEDKLLAGVVEALGPTMLQLHGKETPERVAQIRKQFDLPVIKAIPIEIKSDFDKIKGYADVADWFLFDARAPRDATRPGGLGKPFDWTLLRGLTPGKPFILSGGLNAANVEEALLITKVPAIDVSSGVERALGEKDADKIREFIRVARDAHVRATTSPYRVSA